MAPRGWGDGEMREDFDIFGDKEKEGERKKDGLTFVHGSL